MRIGLLAEVKRIRSMHITNMPKRPLPNTRSPLMQFLYVNIDTFKGTVIYVFCIDKNDAR